MENSGPSAANKKIERIFPWKKAWETLKAIWPQLVYISLVSMSIPQYLLFYFSTQKVVQVSSAFQIKNPISFDNALNVLRDFGIHYLGIGFVVAIFFLLGCFTAVAICLQNARSEPIDVHAAFKKAVAVLMPRGFLFFIIGLLLSLLALNIAVQIIPAQFVRFLGLVLCVLLSALPALMTLDGKHPWQSLKKALSMDYVSFSGMSKWSAFFLLLTFELLALNAVALFEWLCTFVQDIDSYLNIKRSTVFAVTEAFPFGKLIWVTEAIYAVGFAFTTMAFLVLNVTLIYELYRRNTLGRTISVEV